MTLEHWTLSHYWTRNWTLKNSSDPLFQLSCSLSLIIPKRVTPHEVLTRSILVLNQTLIMYCTQLKPHIIPTCPVTYSYMKQLERASHSTVHDSWTTHSGHSCLIQLSNCRHPHQHSSATNFGVNLYSESRKI